MKRLLKYIGEKQVVAAFILFLLGASMSDAQTITPTFIGTGGRYSTAAFGSLEYSIGEAVIGTSSSGTLTVTKGFEQPFAIIQIDTIISSPNDSICKGDQVTLSALLSNASGSESYTWAPVAGLSCSNCSSPVATPSSTTTYTLIVSDLSGKDTAYATIYVSNPSVAAGGNNTICAGETTTLSVSVASGGFTPYTYSWNPPGVTASSIVVTPSATTDYTLTLTDSIGCTSVAIYTVTVNPLPTPTITASPSNSICSGDVVTLTAGGGSSYLWSTTEITTSITDNPTISTSYTVTATDGNGCSSDATIFITVNDPPLITTSLPATICNGNSTSLSVSVTTGNSPFVYSWSPAASLNNGSISNPVATPSVTTDYTITVTDKFTCKAEGTILITVNPVPTPSITASPALTVCNGGTVTLTGSGGTTYAWSPGGQTTSAIAVSPSTNTTYTLLVSNGSCSANAITTVTVLPTPTVTISPNTTICNGESTTLMAGGGVSYVWGPGGETTSSIVVSPVIFSSYYVIAYGANGCSTQSGATYVTVNPAPSTPTAGSNSPVCAGSDISLTATTVPGATYTWSGPNAFTSTSQNPVISSAAPIHAGTYSVFASENGCNSPVSTTSVTVITITPISSASSNSPVCSGSTLSLTAPAGFTNYSWTGPNSFSSSLQNPTIASVSVAATGTYSVTALFSGCPAGVSTTSVSVLSTPVAPTAGSNSPVCVGDALSLTASTIAGVSYSWVGPNSFTSTLQNPVIGSVTLAAGGNYSVTASLAGCTGPAGTTSVTVNPVPSATVSSNSPVCSGQNLSLSVTSDVGTSYSWTGPNSYTSTVQNPILTSVTTAESGTYIVSVSSGFCSNAGQNISVVVSSNPTVTVSAGTTICAGQNTTLTATPSGGTAPYTYSWSPAAGLSSSIVSNPVAAPTNSTNYSVTVSDNNGCFSNVATVSVSVTAVPTLTVSSNTPVCSGNDLSLTAASATGTSYFWQGPNSFTSSNQNPVLTGVTTAAGGTYSVNTTFNGCNSPFYTIPVIVNSTPTISVNPSSATICQGQSVTLSASGATTYVWNPGNLTSATVVVSPGSPTTYTVNGTSTGCSTKATVSVSVNFSPIVSISGANTICPGTNTTLTASGASTYVWNTGVSASSIIVSPSAVTGFTVTGTSGGCSTAASTTVSVFANPAITYSGNSPVCDGGSATISASSASGSTPFTYSWSTGSSASSIIVNPTITTGYNTTLTTADGCSVTSTTTLVVNPTPVITAGPATSTICAGSAVTLTAGGAADAYVWNPGSINGINAVVSPTSFTTYTVTGTNTVTGCAGSATASVAVSPAPSSSIGGVSSLCMGNSTTITMTVSGGTSPYSYVWSPPIGTSSAVAFTPTISTSYSCTVYDATGCTTSASHSITLNSVPPAPTGNSNSPVCAGADLSLTASPAGPATYSWSGPNAFSSTQQNPVISSVTTNHAGTYSVSAIENGCASPPSLVSVAVNPTPAIPNANNNSPVCAGGDVTLTTSFVAGATYSWNGPSGFTSSAQQPVIVGATTANAGNYMLNITVNGCTSPNASTTVVVNTLPGATINGVPSYSIAICKGLSASLTAAGGSVYLWSPTTGLDNPNISNPVASPTLVTTHIYTVIVTGAGGCTSTATATVKVNDTPTANLNINNTKCKGTCDGGITTSVSGGTPAYTYNWSGPGSFSATSPNITNLCSGAYTVQISDSKGCAVTVSDTVKMPKRLIDTLMGNPVCTGSSTTIGVNASGGAGLTYSWSGPAVSGSGNVVSVAPSTTITYTVIVTSLAGCKDTGYIPVSVLPVPPVTHSGNTSICSGQSTTLGATGAASYLWNPGGQTTNIINTGPLTANTVFTITITNAAGCSNSDTLVVSVVPTPTASISVSPSATICPGTAVTLAYSGSTSGSPTYNWSTGSTNTSIGVNPTASTTYSLIVSNGGCKDTATQLITVAPLSASITASSTSICAGDAVTLSATSGLNYSWSTGATTAVITPSPVTSTLYTATISNAQGCSTVDSVFVTVTPVPAPTVSAGASSICLGSSVALTAGGGSSYQWAGGPATAVYNATPSAAGSITYSVTVFNGSCSADTSITIQVLPKPAIFVTVTPQVICPGDTATLAAGGGVFYIWNTGQTTNTLLASPGSSQSYTVTGYDLNQCSNTATATVSVDVISVDAGADQTICPGFTANLNASVTGATGSVSYVWIPGHLLNDSLIANPSANPDTTTTFWVVASSGNCASQDSVTIFVVRDASCVIHIYNGITPNGDGSNDIWYIDGIQSFPDNKVKIFNRWGNKVWEAEGYDNSKVLWRGQSADNSPLPDGTYYYSVELFENNAVIYSASGWVEITR